MTYNAARTSVHDSEVWRITQRELREMSFQDKQTRHERISVHYNSLVHINCQHKNHLQYIENSPFVVSTVNALKCLAWKNVSSPIDLHLCYKAMIVWFHILFKDASYNYINWAKGRKTTSLNYERQYLWPRSLKKIWLHLKLFIV